MKKLFNINDLLGLEEGCEITILGGAPTEHLTKNELELLRGTNCICLNAINASFVEKMELNLKYHVLSDYRFNFEKGEYLNLIKEDTYCVWADYLYDLYIKRDFGHYYLFNLLGYEGFSKNPSLGMYSGYTVLCVALQLCYYLRPSMINIVGVDLYYGLTNTRFYQKKRSHDVDLHVANKQLYCARQALEIIREVSRIKVFGDRSLIRGYSSQDISEE